MLVKNSCAALVATSIIGLSTCTLLVDYTAPSPPSALGSPQLEGTSLGDHRDASAPGGSPAFIQPGTDPNGKPALHYHRSPNFRRAEVKAKGTFAAGKQYFVGYEFRLSNVHEHLALFQWKKEDKSTGQNIPFNIQFTETSPTKLSVGYTPAGMSAKYSPIWTDTSAFDTNKTHNIALAWDTKAGNNANKLEMWLDGQSVFSKTRLDLWTGATYPKFGIYRGEKGDHDTGGDNNIFDLWVYRVQISDASLDEVSVAGGIGAVAGNGAPSGGGSTPTAAEATTLSTRVKKAQKTKGAMIGS